VNENGEVEDAQQRVQQQKANLKNKGLFTRNTNFVSRDTIRNNPIIVA
jgi:hypothetical protein